LLLIFGDVILPVLGGIDLICWLLFFITVVDSGRGSFSLLGCGILGHLVSSLLSGFFSWGLSSLLIGWGLSGLLFCWGLSGLLFSRGLSSLLLGVLCWGLSSLLIGWGLSGLLFCWVLRGLLSLVISVLGDFIDWGLGRRVFGGFLLFIDGGLGGRVL